jgi:hypothetical protein
MVAKKYIPHALNRKDVKMKNLLLKPFIALSSIGLLLSVMVHIIALSGGRVPFENYVWGLHVGIFVV